MMNEISILKNRIFNSNTYILGSGSESTIIIDPGNPEIRNIYPELFNKKQIIVLLTHEHADHCAGLHVMADLPGLELFCTCEIASGIADKKKNLSFYLDSLESFEIGIPYREINDMDTISLSGTNLLIIKTPGHSPGSLCIISYFGVFTGDTLFKNGRPNLSLPWSNKKEYINSIKKLKTLLKPGMMVYPGHGEPFEWNQGAGNF